MNEKEFNTIHINSVILREDTLYKVRSYILTKKQKEVTLIDNNENLTILNQENYHLYSIFKEKKDE